MKPSLLALTFIVGVFSCARAQQWSALGSGLSGPGFEESVVDKVVEIDGSIYVCGYFNNAGDINTWSVAYWDGQAWHGHANGIDSMAGVLDLVKYNGQILAFLTWGASELIYAWNGSNWQPFPSTGLGTANIYADAEVNNGQLYLLQDAEGIYRFNGLTWDKLSGSDQLEGLRRLASYKNELYIGTQHGLYKYNGSQIQQVWAPANIYGLKVLDNTLYMTGGYLGVVGTSDTMTGVAMFDGGVQPTSLGKTFAVDTTEFSEVIFDVTKTGNRLVAGGDVHDDIFGRSRILTYGNGAWQVIGVADDIVKSLATVGTTVYVGGYFFHIGNQSFSNIAAVRLGEKKISGKVFLDLDNNCIFEGGVDVPLNRNVIQAIPGPSYALTDDNGNYSMFLDSGSYTVRAVRPEYANPACPADAVRTIVMPEAADSALDFSFKPIDDSVRVQPYLFSTRTVPGRRSTMIIEVINEGGVPASNISVRLELGNQLTYLSSDHPVQQLSAHEYLFTINNLSMQNRELIVVTDSVDVGASLGEFILSRVYSFGFGGIGDDFVNQEVVGPLDPNEKLVASHVLEGAPYVTQDTIDANDELTYQINFQNVGTDTAYRVVIRDTISPYLDLSTLKTLSASHPYTAELLGSNMITWTFDNIKLPDSTTNNAASNGGIRYRISQTSGNTPGRIISNKAAIYFDFNPPVITNEAINIIGLPAHVGWPQLAADAIRITPNPAREEALFDLPGHAGEIATITFYNVLGEEVHGARYTLPATIDLRPVARGMHFVNVRLLNGRSFCGKILIE